MIGKVQTEHGHRVTNLKKNIKNMIKKQFTIKNPSDIYIKYDLIDTEYWEDIKKTLKFSEISWETFHYRNDCPAFQLEDGRIVHKYFYNTFLHLFNSIDDFMECYQKDRFYFIILYNDPEPDMFYYCFDLKKIETFNKHYNFLGEEDEFHRAYIAEEDGSVKYLYKPHENVGLWFENLAVFNRFLPYYKGEL